MAEPLVISTEDIMESEPLVITLDGEVFRCSRCDAQRVATGEKLAPEGIGDANWKRHVDTVHRYRAHWK